MSISAIACYDTYAMANVVVFHHVLGLTEGVLQFAESLRADGHNVWCPDLFKGKHFESLEEGCKYEEDVMGWEGMIAESEKAVADVPADAYFLGFSMGAVYAQRLAELRPGAKGAILMHGCVQGGFFATEWPAGVRLQIHQTSGDPWTDMSTMATLCEQVGGELYEYPGPGHILSDPVFPEYNAETAELILGRVKNFLRG